MHKIVLIVYLTLSTISILVASESFPNTSQKKKETTYLSQNVKKVTTSEVEELGDQFDSNKEGQSKDEYRVGKIKKSQEKKLQRRIKSKSFTYAGFGPSFFLSNDDTPLLYHGFYGKMWDVNPRASIKWTMGLTAGEKKTYFADSAIGTNLYLNDTDISPFLNADFGAGFSKTGDSSSLFGFKAGIGLGLHLFRVSTTGLEILAKYNLLLRKQDNQKMPQQLTLSLGILF